MRSFHLIIHRNDSPEQRLGGPIELDGQTISVLRLEPSELDLPLSISFDDALDRLAALPRMFIELDGSFVWVGQDEADDWQLDGQLHEGATGLMDVELKGCAPRPHWRQLICCLGWPQDRFLFQLIREGVFVDPTQFERLVWPDDSASDV